MPDAFDLRRFAPPRDVTFQLRKHGDHVFAIDPDPDVDDVARMLRIENVIRGREEGDIGEAFAEAKRMLLAMVQEQQPDVIELRIGTQEITIVFALILHGDTVAEAVLEAITQANALEPGSGPSSASEHAEDDDPEGAEGHGAPLRSEKPSSAASSSSDESDASLLAIGTA